MGNSTDNTGAVDITEQWLEGYELAPGVARAKLWDARLSGFGVIIGTARLDAKDVLIDPHDQGHRARRRPAQPPDQRLE
jgi:hypothetical protein